MDKKWLSVAVIVALTSTAGVAQAAVFLSDDNAIRQTEAITDDVYAASNTVFLENAITGDVFAAGQNVEVSGPVTEDVYAAGDSVSIKGSVGDDLFAAGQHILITAPQIDDVFAAGKSITIAPETKVARDAFLAGQDVRIAGTYQGTVRVSADTATIVAGTTIQGDVISYGPHKPTIQDGAVVVGKVQHKFSEMKDTDTGRNVLANWIREVLTWFIAAIVLLYLFPSFIHASLLAAYNNGLRTAGAGLLWLVLCVPISILLAITIVGLPLMFIVLLATALLLILAAAFANILAGDLAMRRVLKLDSPLTWQHILLGTVTYQTLQLLPIIGGVVTIVMMVWAAGSIVRVLATLVRTPAPVPPSVV